MPKRARRHYTSGMHTTRFVFALIALFAAAPADALDGKWTPAQVLDLDPKWLKRQGLSLSPSALWDGERGTGVLTGTVNIAGCSGAFVSKTGLIVTNHHCLFGLLQEHSTPQRDLIANGFLARTQSEELAGSTIRVEIPKRFTDVTAKILATVPVDADPLARLQAIDAMQKTPRHRRIRRRNRQLVVAPSYRRFRHRTGLGRRRRSAGGPRRHQSPVCAGLLFSDLQSRIGRRRFRHGAGLSGRHLSRADRR